MITVRLKFSKSRSADRVGVLSYQIICDNITGVVRTDYELPAEKWDEKRHKIISSDADFSLRELKMRTQHEMRRLRNIMVKHDEEADLLFDVVRTEFERWRHDGMLSRFMRDIIARMQSLGRVRSAETYQSALRSFMRFRGGRDILLDELDADMVADYQSYLLKRGLSMNTVSFYMRILRATCNLAIDRGLREPSSPFRHVYTGNEKTPKRAIPFRYIKRIKELNLTESPSMDFARDIFLFSFYTRGMSFVDIAFLRYCDLHDGVLVYRRHKTSQQLRIKWERCMQSIVDKYRRAGSDYMFPIVKSDDPETAYRQYRNRLFVVNARLKSVGRKVGLRFPLSTYVARHSWASIAKSLNIPISVISEGMGHDSEMTTQIYLASLDNSVVDRANAQILKGL